LHFINFDYSFPCIIELEYVTICLSPLAFSSADPLLEFKSRLPILFGVAFYVMFNVSLCLACGDGFKSLSLDWPADRLI